MKKIVKGNDCTLRIPVKKMVDGEQVSFPLPACTDLAVNLISMSRRYPLTYSIDVADDSALLAHVEGGKMPATKMALEVKGKYLGFSWRSNEYSQIEFVDNNAAGDTEFGDTDEGEQSVEMDTAVVILAPSDDMALLISDAEKAIKAVGETDDTAKANENQRVANEAARIEAEASRVDVEASRVQAEESRVSTEASRVQAEASRVSAEVARAEAETSRVSTEADRMQAEVSRVSAEVARAEAELTRESNETQRKTSEASRSEAETQREANETARQKTIADALVSFAAKKDAFDDAESSRVAAEKVRETNEATRKANEDSRKTAETSRDEAEASRAQTEASRVASETTRVSAEQERENNESRRKVSETLRNEAEASRVQTEASRVTAETARINAETERKEAESGRASAEANRVKAETSREATMAKTKADCEAATKAATDAASEATMAKTKADCEAATKAATDAASEATMAKTKAETATMNAETATTNAKTATTKAETATAGAEKVNATIDGVAIKVTDRNGDVHTYNLEEWAGDEQVNIKVSTSKADVSVEGLNIYVYFNGSETPASYITDSNGEVTFSATHGSYYKIVYPDVADCDSIPSATYVAVLKERNIAVTYNQRPHDKDSDETVNVCTQKQARSDDGTYTTSGFGGVEVVLTYDDTTITQTTDADGKATFVVPLGQSYTVKIAEVDDWYASFGIYERTKKAVMSERDLYFNYYEYRTGVFIVDSTGADYTQDEWTASGKAADDALIVKLVTHNLLNGNGVFGISIAQTQSGYPNKQWCESNVQFNNIALSGNNSSDSRYYNGQESTALIIDEGESRDLLTPAASYCYEQTIEVDGLPVKNGYLPSIGQWVELWKNVTDIDNAIKLIKGDSAKTFAKNYASNKWSSTQASASYAWYFSTAPLNSGKSYSGLAVPFYAC